MKKNISKIWQQSVSQQFPSLWYEGTWPWRTRDLWQWVQQATILWFALLFVFCRFSEMLFWDWFLVAIHWMWHCPWIFVMLHKVILETTIILSQHSQDIVYDIQYCVLIGHNGSQIKLLFKNRFDIDKKIELSRGCSTHQIQLQQHECETQV